MLLSSAPLTGLSLRRRPGNSMLVRMSEPWPWPDKDAAARREQAPPRPLTAEEQAVVFRAQLILFIVMGVFILAPFVVWWLLGQNK